MSLLITLNIIFLGILSSSAQLVQNPPAKLSQEITNPTTTSPPLLLSPTNDTDPLTSLLWTNPTNATEAALGLEYSCSGQMYGFSLRWQSCTNALEQIKLTDPSLHTYGYRGKGQWDFHVPQRWISADGLCSVDAVLPWGTSSCWSSELLIGRGGVTVLKECVGQDEGPNTGGVVQRIGGDNCIQVSLSKQTLDVVCSGAWPATLRASCKSVVDTMPLDDVLRSFGVASPRVASVELPFVLMSRDRKCAMAIRSRGLADTATWWDFWTAAVQLTGVCVRGGKGGKRVGMGTNGRLSIELIVPQDGVSAS